ncbi:response regulator [Bradyrhizobium uaiense]|uniref:Response regulator n=1 Tax=Bradyrhizobium uaiense TaxID=2594946 RepID=A0A6P1BRK1_9BRAD|nr:response regulator [Bradyrhizobium uaiense]NEV00233.1 response regulator [Bradyrhizobium uaiense]
MVPQGQQQESERVRVLLVEDEWFIRFDVAEELRGAGFEVVEASTADDAMDYISTGERIDALITDVRMPGTLDGLDLAGKVRVMQPMLLILVASGSTELESAASRVGGFISKPYDPKQIAMLIAEMLGPAL